MITEMKKRKYTLKRRAEQQDETRARIVEATMALHEELGPRNATVSAIAERAGVQRLTVYRHFPDDAALFQACTSQWLERNPPPEPRLWSAITDAAERSRAALHALYRYYGSTEAMWTVSYRDVAEVPALEAPMAGFEDYLKGIRDDLVRAWHPPAARRASLVAAAALAVRFTTWQSLHGEGLSAKAMAELMTEWLACSMGRSNQR